MSRTVEVRVAGQSYRVVSSAPEEEVRRLAGAVNAKLAEIVPKGRVAPPNALLLAAIALAHDVEEEREKRESLERRARELLTGAVTQIDKVLGAPDVGSTEDGTERTEHSGGADGTYTADGADAADGTERGEGTSEAEPAVAKPVRTTGRGAAERGAGPGEVSRET